MYYCHRRNDFDVFSLEHVFAGTGLVIELGSGVPAFGVLVHGVDGEMEQLVVVQGDPLQQPMVTLVQAGHFEFGDVVAPNVSLDNDERLADGHRGQTQPYHAHGPGHVCAGRCGQHVVLAELQRGIAAAGPAEYDGTITINHTRLCVEGGKKLESINALKSKLKFTEPRQRRVV